MFCEQRIINNASREGEYIRDRGVPIHLARAAGRPVNDNEPDAETKRLRDASATKSKEAARSRCEGVGSSSQGRGGQGG